MIKLEFVSKKLNLKATVEEDVSVGCYLYVWVLDSGQLVFDTLQDSPEICVEVGKEEFDIPEDQWIEVSS